MKYSASRLQFSPTQPRLQFPRTQPCLQFLPTQPRLQFLPTQPRLQFSRTQPRLQFVYSTLKFSLLILVFPSLEQRESGAGGGAETAPFYKYWNGGGSGGQVNADSRPRRR